MPTEVDWGSLGNGGKGFDGEGGLSKDRPQFFKLEKDKVHIFRPIGKAVEFYKFFLMTPAGKRTIVVDKKDKDAAQKVIGDFLGKDVKPTWRCAMFVINRANGEVEILEGGYQIFEAFAVWAKASGASPGSQASGDWTIKATGDGAGGANPRKYNTQFFRPAPLTQEELSKINKLQEEGKLKFADIYKTVPVDQLVSKLTGESTSGNNAPAVDVMAEVGVSSGKKPGW